MVRVFGKGVFVAYTDSEGPDKAALEQSEQHLHRFQNHLGHASDNVASGIYEPSDQDLHYPLTESLNTTYKQRTATEEPPWNCQQKRLPGGGGGLW